jgi:hypothetical protein
MLQFVAFAVGKRSGSAQDQRMTTYVVDLFDFI